MSFISEVSSSSFFHSSKTSFFWNDLRRKWTCKNLIEVKRGHQKNPRICLYDGFWSNALGYFLRVKWLQMLFQFISFEWDKSLKTNEIKTKTASNSIYWVIKWSRIGTTLVNLPRPIVCRHFFLTSLWIRHIWVSPLFCLKVGFP